MKGIEDMTNMADMRDKTDMTNMTDIKVMMVYSANRIPYVA